MLEKNFVIVNGIGFGEETKGNTVQALVREFDAHTVWRSGGWQGGHHIIHDDDREIALSFYGAGIFEGADTFLHHMVISPIELFQEVVELEELGVPNPLDSMVVHENCLVTTPYHSAISRTREILRGENKKGTIGKGVGEAILDSKDPLLSIRAGEFEDIRILRNKLENIRRAKLSIAKELVANVTGPLRREAREEMAVLYNEKLINDIVDACYLTSDLIQIVGDDYLRALLGRTGTIVNEVSHGTLHHPRYGFLPHVTQIDPTSADVIQTLKDEHYEGRIIRIGVTRSYMTRHGAGPLMTFSQDLTDTLTETHNNAAIDWLGYFRTGHFDIVALQYSLAFSSSYKSFDGLFLSYMDVLKDRTDWPVVEAYQYLGQFGNLDRFFIMDRGRIIGIRVHPEGPNHEAHQMYLTKLLNECRPILTTLTATDGKSLEEVFLSFVTEKLGVPVVATAYGPKVSDRHFLQPLR